MSLPTTRQGASSDAGDAVGAGAGPAAQQRETRRVPVFDGVRGFAALSLLTVHIAFLAGIVGFYEQPPSNEFAASAITGFQLTIGVFFLISGLFLFRPFARAIIADGKGPVVRHYFLRRVLRLLPAYWAMTAAALLLLNFNAIDSLWYVLRPVVLMQNYDPMPMAGMDVSWTVPTEMQWYIALPIIAVVAGWWARRAPDPIRRARRLMVPVVLFLAFGLGWMIYLHLPSTGMFPPEYWWPFGMAGNVAIGMAVGIMSARAQVVPDNPPWVLRVAARHPNLFWLGALAVIAIHAVRPFGRAGYGDYATLGSAVVIYFSVIAASALIITPMIATNGESRLMRVVLGNPVMVYIGRISYGVYLWHFFVVNLYLGNGSIFGEDPVLFHFLRGQAGFWELEIAVLTITIAIATVSYYVLERPLMRLGDRYIRSRRPQPAVTAGVAT